MIIRKHWKLSFVLKALSETAYCRWVGALRALPIEALVSGPVALADYLADRPALLEKPTLNVVVLGTALDAADNGAWWSTVGTLLGKRYDWCHVHVLRHDREDLNMHVRPPVEIKSHVRCTIGDLTELRKIAPPDLVLMPLATQETLHQLLAGEYVWHLIDAGTTIVAGFTHRYEAAMHTAIANVYGLHVEDHQNKFCAGVMPIHALVGISGVKPADLDACIERSAHLAGAGDVVEEICAETIKGNVEPDVFRTWGIEALIKSSVDPSDTYISLPRGYAVRRRTGTVYSVENDLAIGDAYPGRLAPEAFDELPLDAHWATRIGWAAGAWRGGVGSMIGNTLGGAVQAAGFDMPSMEDVRSLMGSIGIEEGRVEAIANALSGGGHYAPSQRERLILDRLRANDEAGMIAMLEREPELVSAQDETRLPLLTGAGRRGMHKAMRQMLALGVDVNVRDGGGRTALAELATTGRSTESVMILLEAGADPNLADNIGWTPLLLALKTSRWENALKLLDAGADPTRRNALGQSAVSLAAGENPMMDIEKQAHEMLQQIIGFDVSGALKNNHFIDTPEEIPEALRHRLLACR